VPEVASQTDFSTSFWLGDFEVIPTRNVVLDGERSIHLEPKIMDVCCFLASRSGEVISRDELIDQVWKLKFGSDESLTRAIYVLRKTFDQAVSGKIVIETVPKRGYRMVLPVARTTAGGSAQTPPDPGKFNQPATALAEPPVPIKHLQEELRHIVFLSCRLDRRSAADTRLDPEAKHAVGVAHRRAVLEVVDQFGGYLASEFGSDLVVCFGFPQAQEDAAERAIRAAQAIKRATIELVLTEARAQDFHLSISVGLHAGVVIVTESGSGGIALSGAASGLANMVRDKAPPDTILMTDVVHELIAHRLSAEPADCSVTSEDGDELQLFQVCDDAETYQPNWSRRELLPFVARSAEVNLLLQHIERITSGGNGSLVLVSGEPGIGKSRLLAEVKAKMADLDVLWIETAGSSLHVNTPFYAVTQLVESVIGWKDIADPLLRQKHLEQSLQRANLELSEAVPLIAEMLGMPLPDGYTEPSYPAEVRRKRLIASLVQWVFNVAAEIPIVLLVEDLHWCDPSSLEFVQLLAEQCSGWPLVVVGTARPEFAAPWTRRPHYSDLALSTLSGFDTRALIGSVLPDDCVSSEVLNAMVERSAGIPLFAEELAHLALDHGRSIGAREIPATLFDLLSARIDKLLSAREIAQLGAVLGREFRYEVLRAIAPMPEDELLPALVQLADAGLLQERGLAPHVSYTFKHALIQDAAYEALLPSRRRELHALVAKTLSKNFADSPEAKPEVVASHWVEAGDFKLALPLLLEAGEAAVARRAFEEAADNLRSALKALKQHPDTPERDIHEVEIGFSLRRILYTLSGYRGEEVKLLLVRNAELSEKMGDLRLLLEMTFSFFVENFMASKWDIAGEISNELVAIAKRAVAGEGELVARLGQRLSTYSRFLCRHYGGEIAEAEKYFRIWDGLPPAGEGTEKNRIAACYAHAAACSAFAGRLDVAMERQAKAVAQTIESGDLWDQAFVAQFGGLTHALLGDFEEAIAASRQAMKYATASGFQQIEALTLPSLGLAQAKLGEPEQGLEAIRRGISKLLALDAKPSLAAFIMFRAEAEALCGHPDTAEASFKEALNSNVAEQLYSPFILIARAAFRIQQGQDELGEADYREALTIAASSGAELLVLRARLGLARLLVSRGEMVQARTMLAECVDRLSAEQRSIDLRAAQALLLELAPA
jgi:predicted ATPase/DNA-binding winged helix-turn-helix (wHTH) protein